MFFSSLCHHALEQCVSHRCLCVLVCLVCVVVLSVVVSCVAATSLWDGTDTVPTVPYHASGNHEDVDRPISCVFGWCVVAVAVAVAVGVWLLTHWRRVIC